MKAALTEKTWGTCLMKISRYVLKYDYMKRSSVRVIIEMYVHGEAPSILALQANIHDTANDTN